MESLSQDSQSYGRNFKLGLPEGEVSVLTCQLRFFLFLTQCDFVDRYQRFGGKYVLHLRGAIQSSFRFNASQLPSFLHLLLSPFLLTSPLQPIQGSHIPTILIYTLKMKVIQSYKTFIYLPPIHYMMS
jgi:hypothetical protein